MCTISDRGIAYEGRKTCLGLERIVGGWGCFLLGGLGACESGCTRRVDSVKGGGLSILSGGNVDSDLLFPIFWQPSLEKKATACERVASSEGRAPIFARKTEKRKYHV